MQTTTQPYADLQTLDVLHHTVSSSLITLRQIMKMYTHTSLLLLEGVKQFALECLSVIYVNKNIHGLDMTDKNSFKTFLTVLLKADMTDTVYTDIVDYLYDAFMQVTVAPSEIIRDIYTLMHDVIAHIDNADVNVDAGVIAQHIINVPCMSTQKMRFIAHVTKMHVGMKETHGDVIDSANPKVSLYRILDVVCEIAQKSPIAVGEYAYGGFKFEMTSIAGCISTVLYIISGAIKVVSETDNENSKIGIKRCDPITDVSQYSGKPVIIKTDTSYKILPWYNNILKCGVTWAYEHIPVAESDTIGEAWKSHFRMSHLFIMSCYLCGMSAQQIFEEWLEIVKTKFVGNDKKELFGVLYTASIKESRGNFQPFRETNAVITVFDQIMNVLQRRSEENEECDVELMNEGIVQTVCADILGIIQLYIGNAYIYSVLTAFATITFDNDAKNTRWGDNVRLSHVFKICIKMLETYDKNVMDEYLGTEDVKHIIRTMYVTSIVGYIEACL